MILTWLLPDSITRPEVKSVLERKLEFLRAVIDDGENGQSLHQSFHRHRYPALRETEIEKFFHLAFTEGITLLPALREFARDIEFQLERDREIDMEIAPARATLNLLTFFPVIILLGALLAKIIHLDRNLVAPIPIAMALLSITLQIIGRRWSESIINSVRS